ncbi:MAG: hypothetical protein WCZ66_07415 [Sphingomonadaceae bacterium]
MTAGEATSAGIGHAAASRLRPQHPGEGETILWQGVARSARLRLLEFVSFALLLGLLSWLALALVGPHLGGSEFAGTPDAPSAVPMILGMTLGMLLIIALPVWLRASARGRAAYMLTNRRALIWLGNRVVGEAILFGSRVRVVEDTVEFAASNVWLDWRLRDQGPDCIRFEHISDAEDVANLAEAQGARRVPGTPE